jgi:hypothetical protein
MTISTVQVRISDVTPHAASRCQGSASSTVGKTGVPERVMPIHFVVRENNHATQALRGQPGRSVVRLPVPMIARVLFTRRRDLMGDSSTAA